MSGRKLAAAMAAIALLTFVLPPLAARQVNERRIDRARHDVERIAAALGGEHRAALDEAIAAAGGGPVVLTGPGAAPTFAPGLGWSAGRMFPWPALSDSESRDPWGNHYLIAVGDGPGAPIVVLSAGPNGVVDTPFPAAASPRSDDIAAERR
ncbi:MAG: hypothetical protein NTV05_12010 [Acidobacteria bacterium]|nr:hypothetical protein [Acidobacteriota bacterium]